MLPDVSPIEKKRNFNNLNILCLYPRVFYFQPKLFEVLNTNKKMGKKEDIACVHV